MARFEYRCRVHGRIREVRTHEPVESNKTCPFSVSDVRCALPLFLAEARPPRSA